MAGNVGLAGELVADGTDFRNGAHLRYKADILVPCGGRPESVNVNNVSQLWDSEGATNFKYIVEGGSYRSLFLSSFSLTDGRHTLHSQPLRHPVGPTAA